MVDRRKFLRLGASAAAAPLLGAGAAQAQATQEKTTEILKQGGEGYSHFSGVQLKAVPSICGQCPASCAILGYLDEGRLVKIEGQPGSIRNQGKVCAKGQAAVEKAYDPDRILTPMRRNGRRGAGKWMAISWDVALDELAKRLGKIRDAGQPERFVFHHGWISASAERLIDDIFLPAYGTGSVIRQTCQGQSARWSAHELTWGGRADSWDLDKTEFILNFGSNLLEAHTNQVPLARRLAHALTERRVRMISFDVRLSNTAARSAQWLPIKPGTDLAVALAMCNVVMQEGLYQGAGEDFLTFCRVTEDRNASTDEKIAALKQHLAQYTPEWAEQISGVSAMQIVGIAREFADARSACVISSRGASARFNGVETERAIQMLAAITGNIDNPGGRCRAITPAWNYPTGPEGAPAPRKMAFIDARADNTALPQFGAGHNALSRLSALGAPVGVYMWYHLNPAFSGADTAATVEILKDETLLPFTVAVTPFYDETAALADLILPDTTFLERFDIEEAVAPGQIAEYALRQPLIAPLGEARDFKDVCLDLAERLGFPLGFESAEKFIDKASKLTPVVKKKARGFKGLKKKGVWHDKEAEPAYATYGNPVPPEALAEEGVIFDPATGVYWNWKAAGVGSGARAQEQGYARIPGAGKGYVGQQIGANVYEGFAPGNLNKSGYFELFSPILAQRGLPALPSYVAIPEHQVMREDQLILTTFKLNVQTLSSSTNSSWLSEIEYDNPAWPNPLTAEARGIAEGDAIRVTSRIGEIPATARVTPTVAPGVLAISTHAGRWEGGRYAAGKRAPFAIDDAMHDAYLWWPASGTHANRIIPGDVEPVSGQLRWMDTVVVVTKE